jgi:hypothetical protein
MTRNKAELEISKILIENTNKNIAKIYFVGKDYVDMESLAKYIVDTGGYGVALARYDSEENEEYILGKLYYIFRID